MKKLKRYIRNWLGIIPPTPSYPHRFVVMVNWHDTIIAVDGNGDIWELRAGVYGDPLYIQLMMRNPLEGGR